MTDKKGKRNNIFLRILPAYGWAAVLFAVGFQAAGYFDIALLTRSWSRFDLTTALDRMIPFYGSWIIVYAPVCFILWGIGFYFTGRETRPVCFRIIKADIIALCICFICFLGFPTTMVRPAVSGQDIFSRLIRLVYGIDIPVNLFPSIHCMLTWLFARTCRQLEKAPAWYRCVVWPAVFLVIASTLFVKQHVIADVPAGVLTAEAGMFIASKIKSTGVRRT